MHGLLLLLILPVVIASQYFELDHKFSDTVRACDDFYTFVCNPEENKNGTYMYHRKKMYINAVLDGFKNYSDPIADYIRDIYFREARNRSLFLKGQKIGEEAVKGNGRFRTTSYDPALSILSLTDDKVVRLPSGDNYVVVKCLYKDCPGFIKGIVHGFKSISDAEDLLDLSTLTIKAKYVVDDEEEFTQEQKDEIDAKIFGPEKFKNFHIPYLNLVALKFGIERGLLLSEELEVQYESFYKALVNETVEQLKRQTWIPEDKRQAVIQSVYDVKPTLYLSKASKNIDNVNEAIDFFVAEFEKVEPKLRLKFKDESCDIKCLLSDNDIGSLTLRRYQYRYGKTDKYVDILEVGFWRDKIYIPNSLNMVDRLFILPSFVASANEDFPLGFRFGLLGHTLAHELFHTLDPKWKTDGDKRANMLHGLKEYDEAIQCYKDYYGSFSATAPNGTLFFPDGATKMNEGFADLEGGRAALVALGNSVFKGGMTLKSAPCSISRFNDYQWYFITAMAYTCGNSNDSDFEVFLSRKNTPHPRDRIRLNAFVRQMPMFSQMFYCKPGDPMYVVEKQCKAFPIE
uniref:Peptidase_M13 domain-containing protein n=1 Tax=Steinernema glaseri TaxID=37863 RepID=A0A1I8AJ57_9BILA